MGLIPKQDIEQRTLFLIEKTHVDLNHSFLVRQNPYGTHERTSSPPFEVVETEFVGSIQCSCVG